MNFAISDAVDAIAAPVKGYRPARELASSQEHYHAHCERALDYYFSGTAQRAWLARELHRRLGRAVDPKRDPGTDTCALCGHDTAHHETSSGRIIREGQLELVTMPTVQSAIADLSVLYSTDELQRRYRDGDGKPAPKEIAETIDWYHAPNRGMLAPKLCELDALVELLRTVILVPRWCESLGHIQYDIVPPHWVRRLPHPGYPTNPTMDYAVALRETYEGEDGTSTPVWAAYVRPPFPDDPPHAITRRYPQGRFVRYRQARPWPVPEPGTEQGEQAIIKGEDKKNPLVEIDGVSQGGNVWNPLVWHWARPPVEDVFLPPQDDLIQLALEIDVAMSLVTYVANFQSYGQAVQKGIGTVPDELGPSTVVVLDDPAGDFKFAQPGADIPGHIAVIRALIQTSAQLRKMTPDSWSTQRPSIQTGPAKLLEQVGQQEARWKRSLMADVWEADRFAKERVIHNGYAPKSKPRIPWDVEQSVYWGELRVPIDRKRQVERLAMEVEKNFASQIDALVEIWGIDRDEARRKAKEILADKKVVTAEDKALPLDIKTKDEGDEPPVPGKAKGGAPPPTKPDESKEPAEKQSEQEKEPKPEGKENSGDMPKKDGAPDKATTEAMLFNLKVGESLVKMGSPQEMIRALVAKFAKELDIDSAEVIAAIMSNDFRWYTAPPEETEGQPTATATPPSKGQE